MRRVRQSVTKAMVLFLLSVVVLTTAVPLMASAAEEGFRSWVRTNPRTAATPATDPEQAEQAPNDNDPDPLEKLLAKMVASLATGIRKAVKTVDKEGEGEPTDAGYDFSITGIIMGKVTHGNSYFVFDLTDQNIYGRIGASIYVLLRAFCFAVLFLSTIYRITKSIYITDGKGLSHLKDAVLTTVIVMVLMFIMPQIVDYLCEVRDRLCVIMYEGMTSLMGGDAAEGSSKLTELINMEEEYYQAYDQTPNLLNALVYFMMCLVPFIFIVSYLRIAISQTVLFGLFPIFAVLSPGDKHSLNGWTAVVFSNIFIPTIDITLLLLPMLLLNVLQIETNGNNIGGALLQAIITVVMMMSIVPVRNQLLSMLGNKFGMKGGLGLLGAGLLAGHAISGAAALAASKMKGSSQKSEEGEGSGSKDDGKSDEALADATKAHVQDIGDVPDKAEAEGGAAAAAGNAPSEEKTGAEERHEEAVNNAMNEAHEDIRSETTTNDGDYHAESVNVDGAGMGYIPTSEADNEVAVAAATAEAEPGGSVLDQPATGTAGEASAGDVVQSGAGTVATGGRNAADTESSYPSAAPIPSLDRIDDGTAAVAAATVTAGALEAENSSLATAVTNRALPINNSGATADTVGMDFNMTRAANLQSIDNMENRSREIGRENLTHQSNLTNAQNQIAHNNTSIKTMEQQLQHMDQDSSSAKQIQGEINKLKANNALQQDTINRSKHALQQNDINQKALKAEVGRRRDIETSMAQTAAASGRGGQVYRNAGDFQRQIERETRERKLTSFRDAIDSRSTAFSDRERREFQRTRMQHDAAINTLKAVGGAAAVTAGLGMTAIATMGAAVGGEDDMRAVASQGIRMSTDPNVYRLPRAAINATYTVDNAFGNRPSAYGRAAGRAIGELGDYYAERAGEYAEEVPGVIRNVVDKVRSAGSTARKRTRETDRKLMDYRDY